MTPTLKKLWNGEISPCSAPEPGTDEAKKFHKLIDQLHNELSVCLDAENQQKLEKLTEAVAMLYYLIIEDTFQTGFSLGVKITAEAFIE
ncbi:MAG: hypothetical protein IJY27_07935 [Clostridia bacterium]|nr:hypothetical protein [Clostridia bacterium]